MRRWVAVAAFALAAFPATVSPATAVVPGVRYTSVPPTRYSLVHGCYQLRTASGQLLGPFTMQAAALGQYLLYGAGRDYLDPSLSQSADPTIWTVAPDVHSISAGGTSVAVTFLPATGCAPFPEAQVDATGSPFAGASPGSTVQGTIDAHTHVTAFEFIGGDLHCGRPWSPYGVATALPDCTPYEQGSNGAAESLLDYGVPVHPHDTRGWPTFTAWPSPTDLIEEGDYYTGIERAWKAGLRVMVTDLVDNEALCQLMTTRHNPCNDMAGVRIQAHDLRALQDYIDAQSGGPGKGFFRIVTDPFQARQVINQGKLAVVEGIEVSDLFDCGERLGVPSCDKAQVDAGLQEVRSLGVSSFYPVHKFDNAFGGAKMDAGTTGELINAGNEVETGTFFNVQTCTGPEHDNEQLTLPLAGTAGGALNAALGLALGGAALPVYPPAPHCNTRGLTDLGAYLINQMIKQHLIVEIDHMDNKTADATLSIIEAHHYSGVISPHSWDSPQENPRIYNTGGFVTPISGASPASFVTQWRTDARINNPRYLFGFGYGADMNGLSEQSQPTVAHPVSYPFTSFDGHVTFTREQWGDRTFDLNKDGLANYGMYADWLQELQVLAGPAMLTDMFHGAEAYLQMWERAYGVAPMRCLPAGARFTAAGLGALRLGASFPSVLYAAGQPASRPGRTYRYCVARGGGASVVFGARGSVVAIISTARAVRAGAVRVGARERALARVARSVGGGLWLGPRLRGGSRLIYGLRAGRVSFAGVTTRRDAGWAITLLRGDLRAAGVSTA